MFTLSPFYLCNRPRFYYDLFRKINHLQGQFFQAIAQAKKALREKNGRALSRSVRLFNDLFVSLQKHTTHPHINLEEEDFIHFLLMLIRELVARLALKKYENLLLISEELEILLKAHHDVLQPKLVYELFQASSDKEGLTLFQDGHKTLFKSHALAKYFMHESPFTCIVFCSSIGSSMGQIIKGFFDDGNSSIALKLDAVASVAADLCADDLELYLRKTDVLSQSVRVGRFSPGYGDFSLSEQKRLLGLVQIQDIDVSLSSQMIMTPLKSVSGLMANRPL